MPRYPSLPRFRKTFFFAALFLFGNFLYPEFEVFDDQPVHVDQRYLIAGWNFNDLSDGYLSQFEVNHGVGILTSDWDAAAFSDFAGTTLNRFGADPAGRDFAFRNGAGFLNEGRGLTIRISMVNFANLAVSYATRRSASGFTDQEWFWSLDGENFVFHERLSAGDSYGLETIDFSDVKELSDVSEVFLRMELRGLPSNPSAAGNNRIDNLRLEAMALRDTAGPGVLTVRNETERDPLRGSDVFRLDLEQVVEFEIRGVEEADIESITIKIPLDWNEIEGGNLELSGEGFRQAEVRIVEERIEISGAKVSEADFGKIRISGISFSEESISDLGRLRFEILTAFAGEELSPVAPRPEALAILPIGKVRGKEESEWARFAGRRIALSGVASISAGILSATELSVFLQDRTGGIEVYSESLSDFWTPVVEGDFYGVVGRLEIEQGALRLRVEKNEDLYELDEGEGLPILVRSVRELLTNPRRYQGVLVRIPRAVLSGESQPWPEPGTNGTILVSDEDGRNQLDVFLNRFTDVAYEPEPDFPLDLVGIFDRFDSGGEIRYRLIPRSREDLLPAGEQVLGYAKWRERYFPEDLREFSSPGDDPDGDGIANLFEYAFGGDPFDADRTILPELLLKEDQLQIRFRRVREASDLVYEVEVSENLRDWERIWSSEDFPFDGEEDILEELVFDPLPLSDKNARFLRVRVILEEGER